LNLGHQQIIDKDILIGVDNVPITRIDYVISYLDTNKKVGDSINLVVNRNGQILNLTAVIDTLPIVSLQNSDNPSMQGQQQSMDPNNNEIKNNPSTPTSPLTVIPGTTFHEGNNFYLVGEVKNNGASVLNSVEVDITLYDINNKVIGTTSTFTNPNTILPFDTAAFKLTVGPYDVNDVNAIKDWRITTSYR
jgi:hypothetical protein